MRYGTFDYGTGILYGSSGKTELLWGFQVDWDNDGVYSGANEAENMTHLSLRRGREFLLNETSTGFEPVRPGEFTATLDNTSGVYNPYNADSALYPNVVPGRKAKLTVRNGSGGTLYTLMTGTISAIEPISQSDQVRITVVDGMQWLMDREVAIAIQQAKDIDYLIDAVLTDAQYPTDWSWTLEDSSDIVSYYYLDKTTAQSAIQDLINAGLDWFFIAADGKAKYYSRSHSVAATAVVTSAELHSEIQIQQPWYTIRNVIRTTAHPKKLETEVELWRLGDKPLVAAGATLELWGTYAYESANVPAINVDDPIAGASGDYTMNTADDGGGTDLTSSFSVTVTKFSQTAKIVLVNSASSDGYVTLLKLIGDAVTSPYDVSAIEEDATSIAAYGSRTFTIDSPWLQDTNTAVTLADYVATMLGTARGLPIVRVESRPEIQFAVDLFDTVDVSVGKLGINEDYMVGYIEHEWLSETGQAVLTTWHLEPAAPSQSGRWTFTTLLGTTSYFSY